MTPGEIIELCQRHTLSPWRPAVQEDALAIVRGEGVYVWDGLGRRILDFASQLVCVNVGHGLNTFFFTLSGADANEHALKIARRRTGKFKILSRYRSYHGATAAALQASGDRRTFAFEPGPPGFVHLPHTATFAADITPAETTQRLLEVVEGVIAGEGAQNIAAMIIEAIPGSNGVLLPPPGYVEGLAALLRKHKILLICDEVMTGFGRTGRMFGFEHFGIVPDLVTCAKGLTSAYAPLGCVALRDEVAEPFRRSPLPTGLTYSAHQLGLAAALAVVDVIENEGLVERAATSGHLMSSLMQELAAAHPSIREVRSKGLLGVFELVPAGRSGERPLTDLLAQLWRAGLYTFANGNNLLAAPPLCIDAPDLRHGLSLIEGCLSRLEASAS
jgi:taurine--2-oxoglutarate transaminase